MANKLNSSSRVCIPTMYYPPDKNGIATYAATLATGLRKKGLDVFVVTRKRPRTIKGINIFQVDVPSVDLSEWYEEEILWDRREYCLKFAKGLYDFLKKEKFDVVNSITTWDDYLMAFSVLKAKTDGKNKLKLVITAGGGGKQPPAEMNPLRAEILNTVDMLTAMGRNVERQLLKIGVKKKLIKYVPPGIDPVLFELHSKPVRDEIMVLFVGRIDRVKGLLSIIQVAKKLRGKKFKFRLVGEAAIPEERKIIQRYILKNKLNNVSLERGVENNQIPKLLAEADIFIYPSYEEWFGISVLEAIASGLPCIVSNKGELSEMVVNGKNGFVVNPKNVKEIERALILLKDSDLRSRFGKVSRQISKKFSVERLVSTHLKIYAKI